VFLIALGFFFLLNNLGLLPALNWAAAIQLWPLLLIFVGLNIIVRQAPGLVGTLLSLLVAIAAVAVFGYLLVAGDTIPFVRGITAPAEFRQERLSLPADGVNQATIALDLNEAGGRLFALEEGDQVIEAQVSYRGELQFDTAVDGGVATVNLRSDTDNNPFFWLNPENWQGSLERWQIGLHPEIPLELNLDVGSGSATIDLGGVQLRSLAIDGGSGPSELSLPGGDYDVTLDAGSGPVTVFLPNEGEHVISIDGGSGSLVLHLPATMATRLVVDDGSGGLSLGDVRRLEQVRGEEDEGVWQTPGYDQAEDRLDIHIEQGSGGVRFEEVE
jgi:hypothetical protein